jgi:DNA-binding transcriptional ArsR family regulator
MNDNTIVLADELAQKPSHFLQVDNELIQHSGRTAALIFAVIKKLDPLVGDGDGATIADIKRMLDLGDSTVRRTLAKLEALGLILAEQKDYNSPKVYETEYSSFASFLVDQETDEVLP